MRRVIEGSLKAWRDGVRRKPLVVRGARQVGKSYSVQEFGRTCFRNVLKVDFERDPGRRTLFDRDLAPSRIVAELELVSRQPIRQGETLLFLDEVQACPRAVAALRYFYEELPGLHVVAAGSLLDMALGEAPVPVGRLQYLTVRPLTFAEFLDALGCEALARLMAEPPHELGEPVHRELLDHLRRYLLVGGMPEAVATLVATGSLREALQVHGELMQSWRDDMAKYRPRVDPTCLFTVLTSLARSVGRQIKYARLAEGYANPTLKRAFELLCRARLATRVAAASPEGLPLGATASAKVFKSLVVDVGLVQHLCGLPPEDVMAATDLVAIHQGALAEQFVGQELLAALDGDLHYWSRPEKSSGAEVDFLVALGGRVVPVEVKSGRAGRLRSLHLLLGQHPACAPALVFSAAPYAELPGQGLTFVPLYWVAGAVAHR